MLNFVVETLEGHSICVTTWAKLLLSFDNSSEIYLVVLLLDFIKFRLGCSALLILLLRIYVTITVDERLFDVILQVSCRLEELSLVLLCLLET